MAASCSHSSCWHSTDSPPLTTTRHSTCSVGFEDHVRLDAKVHIAGQLVDELSLVWIITVFLVVYIPIMKWFPKHFSERLTLVRWVVLIVTALVSALCFLEPNLNAVALMLFSIPAAVVINYEGRQWELSETNNCNRWFSVPASQTLSPSPEGSWLCGASHSPSGLLIVFSVTSGSTSVSPNTSEASEPSSLPGTPYLHALFHLLAGLAGYTIFIMFSMIDIESRSASHRFTAAVRYFPYKNGSIFSFPYISLKERSQ